jgi:hypothetical protein
MASAAALAQQNPLETAHPSDLRPFPFDASVDPQGHSEVKQSARTSISAGVLRPRGLLAPGLLSLTARSDVLRQIRSRDRSVPIRKVEVRAVIRSVNLLVRKRADQPIELGHLFLAQPPYAGIPIAEAKRQ